MPALIYPLILTGPDGLHRELWSRDEALDVLGPSGIHLSMVQSNGVFDNGLLVQSRTWDDKGYLVRGRPWHLFNAAYELLGYDAFHEFNAVVRFRNEGREQFVVRPRIRVPSPPYGMTVPNTGGGWSRYYRHPATASEARLSGALDEQRGEAREHGVVLKARKRRLYTAWDDILRRDREDRSWKRHRPHQWKG